MLFQTCPYSNFKIQCIFYKILSNTIVGDYMNYTKLNMTNDEYTKYAESKVKPNTVYLNCLMAFIIGGLICCLGELFFNIFVSLKFDKIESTTISTILLILLGAALTALRLYSKIGKVAGAGSIIPITGFSNSIVAPAMEHKTEGLVLGIGANMFKVAGPVIVYGVVTSFVIGFIYWIYLTAF